MILGHGPHTKNTALFTLWRFGPRIGVARNVVITRGRSGPIVQGVAGEAGRARVTIRGR